MHEEAMTTLGKESLANAIRREIIGHAKKYGLPIDEAEEVVITVAREIDAYHEATQDAA